MRYRKLGRSGVDVSTLCLGTMTLGEADAGSMMHQLGADEATSHAVLSAALDAGVNFWDTADVYGQDGLSERVLGSWFASTGRRDEVVLATKFRFRMAQGPNGTGAARRRVVRCIDDSLKRLKTDRIDLYQVHMQDLDTPEDELLRALDDLVTAGKVLYVGCSNYAAWRLVDSLWTSHTKHYVGYVTQQMQYSLMVRDLEREHLPLARERGVGVLAWSPLAGGFLTGKYRKDQPPPPGARLEKWKARLDGLDTPRSWATLAALDAVAAETGATVAQVALAWVLHQGGVTAAIVGVRSPGQLADLLPAADLDLTPAQLGALDAASTFELGYPYAFAKNVQGRW